MKIETSKYCQECLNLRQKKCKGKINTKKPTLLGQIVNDKFDTGLNFCSQFIFDERLYKFPDGSKQREAIEKEIEILEETLQPRKQQDIFDLSENLSSKDFADLI